MNRETILPRDKDHWLSLRVQDLTSTEVSALFGLSPYLTEFELWHRKAGRVHVPIKENERMKWGSRLEASIAQGAAEDHGWKISHMEAYMRIPELRLGSSFDYRIDESEHGKGLLEIKNVDAIQFARNWIERDDGSLEAPEHIELQVQHQLEVADVDYAYLVALVGGNTTKVAFRKRDRQIAAMVRAKAQQFWASIDSNTPPKPDFKADSGFITKQLRGHATEGLVVQADVGLDQLLQRYRALQAAVANAEKEVEAVKAEILMLIGDASKVIAPSGTLSCGLTKGSPGTLITPDLVGTYVGARSGYRSFRFTQAKAK